MLVKVPNKETVTVVGALIKHSKNNAAATKTPIDYCASTFLKAQTYPSIAKLS